jgi:hypothetical protein
LHTTRACERDGAGSSAPTVPPAVVPLTDLAEVAPKVGERGSIGLRKKFAGLWRRNYEMRWDGEGGVERNVVRVAARMTKTQRGSAAK